MYGSINEAGYIKGMNKKGFNLARALSELYANPLDAKANSIHCVVTPGEILLIDNGDGIGKLDHEYLWEAQRENHSSDKSMGIFT